MSLLLVLKWTCKSRYAIARQRARAERWRRPPLPLTTRKRVCIRARCCGLSMRFAPHKLDSGRALDAKWHSTVKGCCVGAKGMLGDVKPPVMARRCAAAGAANGVAGEAAEDEESFVDAPEELLVGPVYRSPTTLPIASRISAFGPVLVVFTMRAVCGNKHDVGCQNMPGTCCLPAQAPSPQPSPQLPSTGPSGFEDGANLPEEGDTLDRCSPSQPLLHHDLHKPPLVAAAYGHRWCIQGHVM